MQAAVAAGLLGLGTVFVGTIEGAARILSAAIPDPKAKVSLPALADKIIADHRQSRRTIRGSAIRSTGRSIPGCPAFSLSQRLPGSRVRTST